MRPALARLFAAIIVRRNRERNSALRFGPAQTRYAYLLGEDAEER
jgi:hypothetical protein